MLVAALACAAFGARAETESDLIGVLQSSAGAVEKCEACKQLRRVGTVASVPALAGLLTDERVSPAARHALEAIPAPEAAAALRDALGRTSGLLKAGVVDSLGWRRDAQAVPLLGPLLSDSDTEIASAAATALGRIGGPDARAALQAARSAAVPAVRPAVLEALLGCAERLLTEKRVNEALALYQLLAGPGEPESIRVAAHAGQIRAAGRRAPAPIMSALQSDDVAAQTAALQLADRLRGRKATRMLVGLLPTSRPEMQVALLAVLQQRDDPAALPAVLELTRSAEPAVRVAAWTCAGALGDAGVVPTLAGAAATAREPAEQKAARQALVNLRRGRVASAMIDRLRTGSPAVQIELARALTARRERSAFPALLQLARSDRPSTRQAAWQALGGLAEGRDVAALVRLLQAARDADEREGVIGVFESLAERVPGGAELDAKPIVRGLARDDFAVRQALLQICAFFVDERLRAAFRAALRDPEERVRAAARRALCGARDVALLPDLLEVARQTPDANLRSSAIEGVVRLAADEASGLAAEARTDALATAFALANRPADMRRVLSGLGRVPNARTLQLAEQAAGNPAVKTEADLACLQIAPRLGLAEFDAVEASLTRLAASAATSNVQTNARAWLQHLTTGWLYAGPYRQKDKGAAELFGIEFAPEQADGKPDWRFLPLPGRDLRPGEVKLDAVARGDHCVVYLRTRVYVPVAQPVVFSLGSDDGIKLWVNGELVHAKNVARGLTPDEDKAAGRLRQGWNDLLVKITQHSGGCGLSLRVTEPGGTDTPGVRFHPRGGLRRPETGFARRQLADAFYAEGAYFGDFNRDGKLDIVAGPFWFEGPEFTTRHEYRPAQAFDPKGYSDNFLTYTGDLNGDGWTDIVCVPWPGKEGYWYENPAGPPGHWKAHLYYDMVGNESPVWADVTGDGRPELIFNNEGWLGYAGPDPANPTQPWVFHAVSAQDKRYQRYTHGVGCGDINGDGRTDIVERVGWWEQPPNPAPGQPWKFHPFHFADAAAQMLVYDVSGDGRADIITAWHCHEYGLVWWEQVPRPGQSPDWRQHVILPPKPDLESAALRVSQLHAFDLVDMNGDGRKDIVTGKRFWAHGPAGDPEPNEPALLLWLELRREPGGGVSFTPHLIDDDSGVGTQVATADLNGDGRPDVIVSNKKGIFVHLSQTGTVHPPRPLTPALLPTGGENSPNPGSRFEPPSRETDGAPASSPAWGGRPSKASGDAGAPVQGEGGLRPGKGMVQECIARNSAAENSPARAAATPLQP